MIKSLKSVRWTRVWNLITAVAIGLLASGNVEQSNRLSQLEQDQLTTIEVPSCFFDDGVQIR